MTRLNGKKRYVFGVPAIIIFVATTAIGYGELRGNVKANIKDIKELRPLSTQMAGVETKVESLEGRIDRFERRQDKRFDNLQDTILKAIGRIR